MAEESKFDEKSLNNYDKEYKAGAYWKLAPDGGDAFYWPVGKSISQTISHLYTQTDSLGKLVNNVAAWAGGVKEVLPEQFKPSIKIPGGVYISGPHVYNGPEPLTLNVETTLVSLDGQSVLTTIEKFKNATTPYADKALLGSSGAGLAAYSRPPRFKIDILLPSSKELFKTHKDFKFMCTNFQVNLNAPFYEGGDPVLAEVSATFKSIIPAFHDMFEWKSVGALASGTTLAGADDTNTLNTIRRGTNEGIRRVQDALNGR